MTALKNLQSDRFSFHHHDVPDVARPDHTTSPQVFEQYLKEHHFKVMALRKLENI